MFEEPMKYERDRPVLGDKIIRTVMHDDEKEYTCVIDYEYIVAFGHKYITQIMVNAQKEDVTDIELQILDHIRAEGTCEFECKIEFKPLDYVMSL